MVVLSVILLTLGGWFFFNKKEKQSVIERGVQEKQDTFGNVIQVCPFSVETKNAKTRHSEGV